MVVLTVASPTEAVDIEDLEKWIIRTQIIQLDSVNTARIPSKFETGKPKIQYLFAPVPPWQLNF